MRYWLSGWGRAILSGRTRRLRKKSARIAPVSATQSLERRDLPAFTTGTVPELNSNPGATATLYLDFDGNVEPFWGTDDAGFFDVTTPNFALDANLDDLSGAEAQAINQIWSRVAEDFAPFNINVTTVEPLDFSNRKGLRVAVGGEFDDWLGTMANGASQLGGFFNDLSNTAYVFSGTIGTNIQNIAEQVSHEAGFAFGLQNQSQYNGMGVKTAELNPGNAVFAPIMGNSFGKARTTWFNGANTVSSTTLQDDIALLSDLTTNGFGFRQDDVGDTLAESSILQVNGVTLGAAGIIGSSTDIDVFQFFTNATSNALIRVTPNAVGANLQAVVELRTVSGQLIASGNTGIGAGGAGLAAVFPNLNLATGAYQIIIRSNGTYGSIGQYTVTGTGFVAGSVPTVTLTPNTLSLPESTSTTNPVVVSQIAINDPDGGTNILTLSGQDAGSFEIVQNQLRLRQGVALDFENKTTFNVRVNVDDRLIGGPIDGFANFQLTITDVNDAPIVAVIPTQQFYISQSPPMLLGSGATLTDQDTPVLNGGSVRVRHLATALATDRLGIRNQGTGNGQIQVIVTNPATNTGTVHYRETINGVDAVRQIGTFTGGVGSTQLVVTLNANATQQAVQQLLRNLTFVNTSANPDNSGALRTRQVRIEVADGEGATSVPDDQTITINSRPTLSGISGSVNYTELAAPVIVGTNGVVTDTNPSYAGATLTARLTGFAQAADRISLTSQGTGNGQVQVIFDSQQANSGRINFTTLVNNSPVTVEVATFSGGLGATALTVTFNANATLQAIQQVLRQINYSNTGLNPTNFGNSPTRVIEFRFNDGQQGISDPNTKTVNITGINDNPVIANITSSVQYNQNGGAVIVGASGTVSDVDSANFGGGFLEVSFNDIPASTDRLEIRNQGTAANQISITGSQVFFGGTLIGTFTGGAGSTPLRITFNTSATIAAVQQLLRNITYRSISDNPEVDGANADRQVKFVVTDGDGGTSAAVLGVVQMNRAPVIAGVAARQNYNEGSLPLYLAAAATVADATSANFDGGELEVRQVGNIVGVDRLEIVSDVAGYYDVVYAFVDDVTTYEGRLFYDKYSPNGTLTTTIQFATFSGGIGGTPLRIVFNSGATPALVQRTLRRIVYRAVGDNPTTFGTQSSRQVRFTLTDGDGARPLTVQQTINVLAFNDVPVVGGIPATQHFTEGGGAQVIASGATVADLDSQDFNGGFVQARFAGATHADDRIAIRHQGTQLGQISISVTNATTNSGTVSFTSLVNGVAATRQIGTFSGGLGATQLLINLNANADAAATQALLRNLTYRNVGDNPTNLGASTSRELRITVSDGDGGISNTGIQKINITAVNDPPVVSSLGGNARYSALGAPALLAPTGVVTDADSTNFSTGFLTIRQAAGSLATDRIEIQSQGTGNGQIKVIVTNAATYSGSLYYSTVVGGVTSTAQIGTFSGGIGSTPLVIQLNALANLAATQQLLRRISFRNTAANPSNGGALPTRLLGIRLDDGDGATSLEVFQTVNII